MNVPQRWPIVNPKSYLALLAGGHDHFRCAQNRLVANLLRITLSPIECPAAPLYTRIVVMFPVRQERRSVSQSHGQKVAMEAANVVKYRLLVLISTISSAS